MSIFTSANNTKVFTHPEAHPHRLDLAAEVIGKMFVPVTPADPSDRNQTRICQTIDLGRTIGQNHLVEINENDLTFMWDRGRGYESRMVLKGTEDETRITTVLFWDGDNNKWILWTNFEGVEGLPEPGCDRYNNAPEEFKKKCQEFWATHALVPTEDEKVKYLKENDVDIEDIENNIEAEEWTICYDDISDVGPFGCYPDFAYRENVKEAIDFALNQIANNIGVSYISAN